MKKKIQGTVTPQRTVLNFWRFISSGTGMQIQLKQSCSGRRDAEAGEPLKRASHQIVRLDFGSVAVQTQFPSFFQVVSKPQELKSRVQWALTSITPFHIFRGGGPADWNWASRHLVHFSGCLQVAQIHGLQRWRRRLTSEILKFHLDQLMECWWNHEEVNQHPNSQSANLLLHLSSTNCWKMASKRSLYSQLNFPKRNRNNSLRKATGLFRMPESKSMNIIYSFLLRASNHKGLSIQDSDPQPIPLPTALQSSARSDTEGAWHEAPAPSLPRRHPFGPAGQVGKPESLLSCFQNH